MIEPSKPTTTSVEITGQLHVVADPALAERWSTIVTAAAQILDLASSLTTLPTITASEDPVQAMLSIAATAKGPVLFLPAGTPPSPGGPEPLRVLVPLDGTITEDAVMRPLLDRALDGGAQVTQLYVLCDATRPVIWEGAGHNASAYLAELRRRHQVDRAELSVSSGDPGSAIAEAGDQADLVILAWQADDSADRASVLRAVLKSMDRPILLVPMTGE